MSTRSCISIEHENGSVSSIYCHGDGYLSGVGLTLFNYYKTTAKLKPLINLGDLSYLGDSRAKGSTFAYKRDRHETDTEARVHDTLSEFLSNIGEEDYRQNWGYEYCYLFPADKIWLVKQDDQPWEPLHLALVTEKLIDA